MSLIAPYRYDNHHVDDTTKLLIMYCQVSSNRIAPLNLLGCWDWCGYTSDDYATRAGPQLLAIKATMDALAGQEL